jgi:FkbM family methyltransferase
MGRLMRGERRRTELDALRRGLRPFGLVAAPDKSGAAHLRSFGLAPDTVIDVGVHRGTPELYRAFPEAAFLLVDPRPEAREALNGPDAPARAQFRQVALGAAPGRMTLAIPETPRGADGARASLTRPVGHMARRITGYLETEVEVTTLDLLAAGIGGRLGLKIDVEGHEADVLRGAAGTLPRCDFVILELSLTPRFAQTSPPSTLFALLGAAGLELRDVLRSTGDGRGGPAPRLFDVLFTRWPEPALPDIGV